MRQKKSNSFLSCLIYIVAIQLYNLQGLFGFGSAGKWIAVAIIAFSLYKMAYVITHYKQDIFLRSVTCLLVLFTAYGLYYIFAGPDYVITSHSSYNPVSKFDYLKNIWISLLPLYVIYGYAKKGTFNTERIWTIVLILLFSSILSFFSFYFGADTEDSFDIQDNLTNNQGYKFVMLIPLLYFVKRWRTLLMVVCMVFIFLSLKRGAMLMGGIAFVFGLFSSFQTSKGYKKFGVIALVAVIALAGSHFLVKFYDNSRSFQRRVDATINGDSSGRDDLVEDLVDYYENEADLTARLFGTGADSTIGIAGDYAHNDWLEILVNQGLLGIAVFLAFFINWFRVWKKIKRYCPKNVGYAFGVTLLIFFLKSVFSMAYTGFGITTALVISYSYYIAQANGYGLTKKRRRNPQLIG